MAKKTITDHWTLRDKPVVRMSRAKVAAALKTLPLETIAGHLDLEGFCFIKVVRTGPHEGHAQDMTQRILTNDIDLRPMTVEEISKTYWKEPAMMKWAKPEHRRKNAR